MESQRLGASQKRRYIDFGGFAVAPLRPNAVDSWVPHQNIATVTALASKVKRLPFYVPWSRATLSLQERVTILDVRAIALTRTAVTSLAIERYRLAKSDLPSKLDDLVPTYLTAIPQDPFDDKPLRYKKLAKGYVVYSVGEDGEDNGGAEKNSEGYRVGKGTDITFIIER